MVGFTSLTALTITAAFAFGLVLALPGSIKLDLAKRLNIGEARLPGLVSSLGRALIPLMVLGGLLTDGWGPRQAILLGSLLTAVGLFTLTLRSDFFWAVACTLVVALGAACLSTASMVLMTPAFFPPGVEAAHREAAALNLGTVFMGLGSLMAPSLADLLLRTARFRWTLGVLALACLVPAALALVAGPSPAAKPAGEVTAVLTHPVVWLAGLVYFLYTPVEAAISTWAGPYLVSLAYKPGRAAWTVSAFWLAFLAARVGMAYLEAEDVLPRHNEGWMVFILAGLAAVALGNLAGAASKGNAGLGLVALGAFLGPVFPTLLSLVFQVPDLRDHQGTAYGLVFAVGSVGGLVLVPFVSRSARATTVQHSFRYLMLFAVILFVTALGLALARPQF